ncbi:MAG: glutamate--cysteine ligase [Gammaproteobacteria bacterium]|nr:glutamate--cysteine ligase [Gammaproteobacteria bacterium]
MSNIDLNRFSPVAVPSTGTVLSVENYLTSKKPQIETWLEQKLSDHPVPFYCSVDVRNAGFKIAPVDTNLFPAGFNNLGQSEHFCVEAVKKVFEQDHPLVKKILIIPEDHTRNVHYYENIFIIQDILEKAGLQVNIGSLLSELDQPKIVDLPSGKQLTLHPLSRKHNKLQINDFIPDLILLNNDLSNGVPVLLEDIDQIIIPPVNAGWHTRLKSVHFNHYQQVATEFASEFDLDPWLLAPLFKYCGKVNFMASKNGEHCIARRSEELFREIETQYKKFSVTQQPYIVVKADAGTYGMAVMMIQDPKELLSINRKDRTRMASIKGGREVHQVIIQEGVHTLETRGEKRFTAEPVIYMIGKKVVGGFYRVHEAKGFNENLNAPGMHFESFDPSNEEENQRIYAYGVIARLALIAAARELNITTPAEGNNNAG